MKAKQDDILHFELNVEKTLSKVVVVTPYIESKGMPGVGGGSNDGSFRIISNNCSNLSPSLFLISFDVFDSD